MNIEELFSGNEQSVFLKDFFIVAPLGKRPGLGTFDTFWNPEKYNSVEEAVKATECIIVDFVRHPIIEGTYFCIYHIQKPNQKLFHKLIFQNFVPTLGVDQRDDWAAEQIANTILEIPFKKDHTKPKKIILPFKKK